MSAPVEIRHAQLSDLDAITEIYNEAVLTTTATFDLEPKSPAERLDWFRSHDERQPILVATLGDAVVGWASLSKWKARPAYDETAETSFYVGGSCRGRGIGRKLKQAIIDEARRLKYHSLIAVVAEGSGQPALERVLRLLARRHAQRGWTKVRPSARRASFAVDLELAASFSLSQSAGRGSV